MSFEAPKTTAPKDKGKENIVRRPRQKYTEDDVKLLSKIIQTAREGKYKSTILGECSSNTEKMGAWEEIKDIYNQTTGKNLDRKQVRDFYNKQKDKAKKKHDTREIEKRKLKTISSTTGGGPGLMLTADVDPDENGDGLDLEGMFSQEMDPVELGCNKLTKPGPSTSAMDDIMTDCSGTPILDSMGLPISQLTAPITGSVLSPTPTTTSVGAKQGLVLYPMRDLQRNTGAANKNSDATNKNSEATNKNSEATNKNSEATNKNSEATNKNSEANNKNSEATNKNSEASQENSVFLQATSGPSKTHLQPKSGPSKTHLEVSLDGLKKQKEKRPKKKTIIQGANQFYNKTYKIQKSVAVNRIRLLKKRVAREDIKIVILKKKAANLGVILESESESSDSDDGISSDSESDEN